MIKPSASSVATACSTLFGASILCASLYTVPRPRQSPMRPDFNPLPYNRCIYIPETNFAHNASPESIRRSANADHCRLSRARSLLGHRPCTKVRIARNSDKSVHTQHFLRPLGDLPRPLLYGIYGNTTGGTRNFVRKVYSVIIGTICLPDMSLGFAYVPFLSVSVCVCFKIPSLRNPVACKAKPHRSSTFNAVPFAVCLTTRAADIHKHIYFVVNCAGIKFLM